MQAHLVRHGRRRGRWDHCRREMVVAKSDSVLRAWLLAAFESQQLEEIPVRGGAAERQNQFPQQSSVGPGSIR